MTKFYAPKPVLFVAGLGRCGSSLTMQMLAAAGIPCAGRFPDFEVDDVNHRAIAPAFMVAHRGWAVKWLDPHLTPPPHDADFITIWLDRNPMEQARSQAKFAHMMTGAPYPPRHQLRTWASNLRRDRRIAMREVLGNPGIVINFEELVSKPRVTAARIARWIELWFGVLDCDRMAAVVRPRSADCQPGMAIEEALVTAAAL